MVATADIDLGLDFDDLAAEEARANRPSFNHNPISWEGDLVSITPGQDVNEKTGAVFPRHSFNFDKVKFLDVGNAVGEYTDGQSYSLLIRPVTDEQKAKHTTRFTEMGKSALASGKGLEKFLGQRVRVTELSETYKNRDGYDRQSYHWQFATVGATSNGTKPAAEAIPADLIEEVLTFIDTYGDAGINHLALAPAIMQNQVLNKNKSLNDQIMAGHLLDVLGTRVTLTEGIVRLAK